MDNEYVRDLARQMRAEIESLPLAEQIAALNYVRGELHAVSPFRSEPVDLVVWVPSDAVTPNDYNPNAVAPPEMRLLERSIKADGYTQPVVAVPAPGGEGWEVVDGFHRTRIGKEKPAIRSRVHGHLPVSVLSVARHSKRDRMAATIRHNRARGVHGVLPMADLVAALIRDDWSDDQIAQELGMDADEVLRFKQTKGLPELFRGKGYSRSWK